MTDRIGRFTKEELIGVGACGQVFRAHDPNFGHAVAIKILNDNDPETLRRFRAEAAVTRALSHKNIVTVYGFEEDNGVGFLQMELLQGKTLREAIDEHSIAGVLEKVEIMYQVAEGLSYAHAKDVIHCDMKPGNIMVLPGGNVKIMDFGIAQVPVKEGTPSQADESVETLPPGTLPYMAPEQFPPFHQTTKVSDIFSFGVIFYELLGGVQPFAARDPRTVKFRIDTFNPQPLREQIPAVPEALDTLLQRLLHKDPELRLQDLQEMLLYVQPIRQELRRARAAELFEGVPVLIADSELKAAHQLLKKILVLDPNHGEAMSAWLELEAKSQAQKLRARIDNLASEGRQHMLERRFAPAISSFDAALHLDGQREDIRMLREEAERIRENVRAAARLVAEARREVVMGRPAPALEKILRALELDPGNAESTAFAAELKEQLRVAHNVQVSAHVQELIAHELFGDALAALADLQDDAKETKRWTRQIETARLMVIVRDREAALAAGLERLRNLLAGTKAGATDTATSTLEDVVIEAEKLSAVFPGEPEPEECLAEIREKLAAKRRTEAISALHTAAGELLTAGDYQKCCDLLRGGLEQYPEDDATRALLQQAEQRNAAHLRQLALTAAAADIQAKFDRDDLPASIEALREAVAQFGEEPELLTLGEILDLETKRREKAAVLAALLTSAKQLIATEQPQQAIDSLVEAEPEYGSESAWQQALEESRQALRVLQAQRLQEKESAIAAADESGHWRTALHLAEEAARTTPAHLPFQRLLEQLRIKQAEAERQEQLAPHLRGIDSAIGRSAWDEAFSLVRAAAAEFRDDPGLQSRAEAIKSGRYQARWERAELQIRNAMDRRVWDLSLERLMTAADMFPSEPALEPLWHQYEVHLLEDTDGLPRTIRMLETLQLRGLSDARADSILEECRQGLARHREALAEAAADLAENRLAGDDLRGALAAVENALKQVPDHAGLLDKLAELRQAVVEAEQSERLRTHVAVVETLLELGDWRGAQQRLAEARHAFPEASVLAGLADAIDAAQRQAALSELEKVCGQQLRAGNLKALALGLATARATFGDEAVWTTQWAALQQALADQDAKIAHLPWLREVARKFPHDDRLQQLEESALAALRAKQLAEKQAQEAAEKLARQAAERQAQAAEREAKEAKRRQQEAEKQAKEAERQAKEVERLAKEAERQAKETERLVREAEREAQRKRDADRKVQEAADRQAKQEAERKAKETARLEVELRAEQERVRQREEAARATVQAQREQQEAQVRADQQKAAARKAKEEAERKAKEDAERDAKAQAERAAQHKAEQDRVRQQQAAEQAAAQAKREQAETKRLQQEEAARQIQQAAERKAAEEAARKAAEEAVRKAKEEAEHQRQQDLLRQQQQEEQAAVQARREQEEAQRQHEALQRQEAERQRLQTETLQRQREAEAQRIEDEAKRVEDEAKRAQEEFRKAEEENRRQYQEAERRAQLEAEQRAEQEALRAFKIHAVAFESSGNFTKALEEIHTGLLRFPDDPDLTAAVPRLEQAIHQKNVQKQEEIQRNIERQRSEFSGSVQAATTDGDWQSATDRLANARAALPDEPLWDELAAALHSAKRAAERLTVERAVRSAFHISDVVTVARLLAEDRAEGAGEETWQSLVAELETELPSEGSKRATTLIGLAGVAAQFHDFSELRAILNRARQSDTLAHLAEQRAAEAAIAAVRAEAEILLQSSKWEEAGRKVAEAQSSFPSADFSTLTAQIEEQRALEQLTTLESEVKAALKQRQLDRAEQLLAEARPQYSQHLTWRRLRRAWEGLKSYQTGLQQAEKAMQDREYSRAKGILKWLVVNAPDARAAELMQAAERAAPKKTKRSP